MPRIKWLKCHRCGKWIDPKTETAERDEYGFPYCSEECWWDTENERGMAEKADREYEERRWAWA